MNNMNKNTSSKEANRESSMFFKLCRTRKSILIFLAIIFMLTLCCSEKTNTDKEITRTLTSDERYLVQTYIKIHKFERNLQNNPEELTKKLNEIKKDTDYERIELVISKLEKDPIRWLAIYNRINVLLSRDSKKPE
ncbi:MAG TPA: hypothetical protein VKO43_00075 [Candidatus Krumholzibacteriaceae bacterium]|nr:hypothetical protein [Candidatus Krumholzibacteriaceae bacterium]